MEMDDNKLKHLLQEGMEWEADRIMAEVNSDPDLQDVVAPEDIHDNLMKQIHEHEDSKEKEQNRLSQEEQELIRLGKILRKKRGRHKYIVLIAAVLCALGIGTISFGDGKKVFTEIKRMLGDREQAVVNTDDGETSFVDDTTTEEEAYEKVNDTFGFYPVPMHYIPKGIDFSEVVIEEDSQNARLYYEGDNSRSISYFIVTNYRAGSIGIDVDDKLIQEYEKNNKGTIIKIQEYIIEENNVNRWMVNFSYDNAQYSMILTGIESEEVDKIVDNLYFS